MITLKDETNIGLLGYIGYYSVVCRILLGKLQNFEVSDRKILFLRNGCIKIKFLECPLEQQFPTWGMRTPGVREKSLEVRQIFFLLDCYSS